MRTIICNFVPSLLCRDESTSHARFWLHDHLARRRDSKNVFFFTTRNSDLFYIKFKIQFILLSVDCLKICSFVNIKGIRQFLKKYSFCPWWRWMPVNLRFFTVCIGNIIPKWNKNNSFLLCRIATLRFISDYEEPTLILAVLYTPACSDQSILGNFRASQCLSRTKLVTLQSPGL